MSSWFDAVDLDRLRARRTVKWSLYGPDVLAAWVAEMDFDVAPAVRRALLDAVDREDFGYVAADLGALTGAAAGFLSDRYGWRVSPTRIFPVADVLVGIGAALDVHVPLGAGVVVPTPAYPPFFEVVELTGRPALPLRAEGDLAAVLAVVHALVSPGVRGPVARAVGRAGERSHVGRGFGAGQERTGIVAAGR